jgi:signal transduction histidine kinase
VNSRLEMELESHLVDPIVNIKIYDTDGALLLSLEDSPRNHMGMMRRLDEAVSDINEFEIKLDKEVIGYVQIASYEVVEGSYVAEQFNDALLGNVLFSVSLAVFLSVLIAIYVSGKISQSLKDTAMLAVNLKVGNETEKRKSNIKEIYAIQESLYDFETKLKLKQTSRKSVVDEVIHQTRTPLTILKSHLEGIEDGVIEVNEEEFFLLNSQLRQIDLILNNLNNFVDVYKKDVRLNIEEIKIHELTRLVVQGLKPQFDKKKITLSLENFIEKTIKTDQHLLSQVLYNVLTNAFKFSDENTNVLINVFEEDNFIVISIEDEGKGIEKEIINTIFDAYQTFDGQGEGLGLFVAKEHMSLLGGDISVTSEVGEGSCFIIRLPIV